MFLFASIIAFSWLLAAIYLVVNGKKLRFLRDQPEARELPSLDIIIAVRNEEADLEQALASVCKLDYPAAKVTVIDDRSTDATPQILARMQLKFPSLSVITIDSLPEDWLGKNHALYTGYQRTNAPWILFTDADVSFKPGSLRKAMHYLLHQELDHLVVLPEVRSRSAWLNSIFSTFKIMLEVGTRPWRIRDPKSRASLGIGAFNLVGRSAYEKAGTHERIRLRPDDDLQLGRILKRSGARQDAIYGDGETGLEWYPNVRSFVAGLMKNTFSTVNYNLFKAIGGAVAVFTAFTFPIPFILIAGDGNARLLAFAALIIQALLFTAKPAFHARWWHALMIPVAGALTAFIILRSAFLTLRQGGIYWRESFYPLSKLREQ